MERSVFHALFPIEEEQPTAAIGDLGVGVCIGRAANLKNTLLLIFLSLIFCLSALSKTNDKTQSQGKGISTSASIEGTATLSYLLLPAASVANVKRPLVKTGGGKVPELVHGPVRLSATLLHPEALPKETFSARTLVSNIIFQNGTRSFGTRAPPSQV